MNSSEGAMTSQVTQLGKDLLRRLQAGTDKMVRPDGRPMTENDASEYLHELEAFYAEQAAGPTNPSHRAALMKSSSGAVRRAGQGDAQVQPVGCSRNLTQPRQSACRNLKVKVP